MIIPLAAMKARGLDLAECIEDAVDMVEPTRRDKILYVLMAPIALGWAGLNFWWLATTGTMPVRGDTGLVWASDGLMFWVSLGLYVILAVASLVVITAFLRWMLRSRRNCRTPS